MAGMGGWVVSRRLFENVVGIRGHVEPDLATELTSRDGSFLLLGGKKYTQSYELHGMNLIYFTEWSLPACRNILHTPAVVSK